MNATKQRCLGSGEGKVGSRAAALAKLTGRLLLREHKVHDFPLNFRLPYRWRFISQSDLLTLPFALFLAKKNGFLILFCTLFVLPCALLSASLFDIQFELFLCAPLLEMILRSLCAPFKTPSCTPFRSDIQNSISVISLRSLCAPFKTPSWTIQNPISVIFCASLCALLLQIILRSLCISICAPFCTPLCTPIFEIFKVPLYKTEPFIALPVALL